MKLDSMKLEIEKYKALCRVITELSGNVGVEGICKTCVHGNTCSHCNCIGYEFASWKLEKSNEEIALNKLGISKYNKDDSMKSLHEVLMEVSDKWNELK